MELIKNKIYRAEFVDYTTDGAAIAKIGGIPVFVPGGAVGDQCDIMILKVNRRMAFGRIQKIIVASKHRIQPECVYADRCGGCCWQHITYAEELRAKQKKVQDALTRIGGISIAVEEIVGGETTTHYRNKAQYPVGMQQEQAVTGFYRIRSHDIVPMTQCLIQSPKADQIATLVRQWMNTYHVPAYDEHTKRGMIRHVYVRTGTASGQTQLCLVAATFQLPALQELIALLTEQVPSLVSIVLNHNAKPNNSILGQKNKTIWGSDTLEDTLCGNVFSLSPQSFYQVNHAQAENLYACAIAFAQLDGTQRVLELYCGAGTITLAMAKYAKRVIGVEVVPEAVTNARENAQRNHIENVEFICADAGQAAMMLAANADVPDVIVVDPPRRGLDDMAISAMVQMQPEKIVYVSCDPATLARDCKLLQVQGFYVEKCRAFDLFPRTGHVEAIVLMTRSGSGTEK